MGKVVVMDSGFCVLEGLHHLKAWGVYALAQIKKRRYWPKDVPSDMIKQYFSAKEVGDIDALHRSLHGTPFNIFCMNEPNYVAMIMSTHSTLNEVEDHAMQWTFKNAAGEKVTKNLKYMEPFSLHYHFHHQIDDHNSHYHSPISLKET